MKQTAKRATIYFEESVYKALRLKGAAASRSLSDLVNQAVKEALAEDEADLSAYRDRVAEPAVAYEDFLRELKKNGKI